MSWTSLDTVAAVATIVAAIPVVAGGIAICVPAVRIWFTNPGRPWAIPAGTALLTSLVTTAIVVVVLGAIGPPGPPGRDGALGATAFGPEGAVVAFVNKESMTDATKQCPKDWHAFEEARGRVIIGAGIAVADRYKQWTQVQPDGTEISRKLTDYPPLRVGPRSFCDLAELSQHEPN